MYLLCYASLFLIANEITHIRMMDEEIKKFKFNEKQCCFKCQKYIIINTR